MTLMYLIDVPNLNRIDNLVIKTRNVSEKAVVYAWYDCKLSIVVLSKKRTLY